MYNALLELQMTHDEARKTGAAAITMDRNLFAEIATKVQKEWEQIKEAQDVYEESLILKSLKHLQASIAGLEQKYEDIQAKVTGNSEMVLQKLNEIHTITTRLENKYEAIEPGISLTLVAAIPSVPFNVVTTKNDSVLFRLAPRK
jgi:hypothetical protein